MRLSQFVMKAQPPSMLLRQGGVRGCQVQISVTRADELGPGKLAAWHSMKRKTGLLANPFLCPEFTVAVGNFRPGGRVDVLTDRPGIVGLFPFQRYRLCVGVPIGAGLSNCQGLICAPGAE